MKNLNDYLLSLPESERGSAEKRVNELLKIGFSSERVAFDLIEYEKAKGVTPKKRVKSEMYDKMNYMCRKYMDRMARCAYTYDFKIDFDAFKDVVLCVFELCPVFHSSFINNYISPYWHVEPYTVSDIFTVKETDDLDKEVMSFLKQEIGFDSNVQFKIGFFTKGNRTALAFYWNHMLMDGGGFHQFFYDVSRAYTELTQNGSFKMNFKTGTRHFSAVYKDMEKDFAKKAKKQLSNVSPREKKHLPFSEKSIEDKVCIAYKEIPKELFSSAIEKAKTYGATANDLLIACYADAAQKMIQFEGNISISSALDLRRYIKNLDEIGYTNHTTFMPCTIENMGGDITETLKKVTASTKKSKSDPFLGLHGLPLLNFAYNAMIYAQAEPTVKFFYNNASFGLSNIGNLNTEVYSLSGKSPIKGFVAGAAKNKPFTFVTALTVDGTLYLTMSFKGAEKDEKMLDEFFSYMQKAMERLVKA